MNKQVFIFTIFFILFSCVISQASSNSDQKNEQEQPLKNEQLYSEYENLETTELLFDLIPEKWADEILFTTVLNLDIKIVIEGNIARTTIRFQINNKYEERKEAVLNFKLPEHSVITGLKLDIRDMMVKGVGVERWLALEAYESETRKRIDPAIIQKINIDEYQLRLYPLDTDVPRTVEIQWIQSLRPSLDERLVYQFPFSISERINIQTFNIISPNNYDLQFKEGPNSFNSEIITNESISEIKLENFHSSIRQMIKYSVNVPGDGGTLWMQEYNDLWYGGMLSGELSANKDNSIKEAISVIWDASLSRKNHSHSRELELLKNFLSYHYTPAVYLTILRNELSETKVFFPDDNYNYDNLIAYLENIPYDGYSDASKISELNFIGGENHKNPPGFHLLFTDFLEYSGSFLNEIEMPVFPIISGSSKYKTEDRLAAASGGKVFNLTQLSDNEICSQIGIYYLSINNVHGFNNWIPEVIFNKKLWALYHKFSEIEKSQINIPIKYFELIDNFYLYMEAQRQGKEYYPRDRESAQLLELVSDFNIVTNYSSLLVLESPEQYVRWGITPPVEAPWDHAEYEELLSLKYETEELQTPFEIRQSENFQRIVNEFLVWSAGNQNYEDINPRYFNFDFSNSITTLPDKCDSVRGVYYGGCFPANTEVHTQNSTKYIQNIKTGDIVLSFNPEIEDFVLQEVIDTQVHLFTGDLVHLNFKSETIYVSGNHPILLMEGNNFDRRPDPKELNNEELDKLKTGRWIEARDVEPGDVILMANGQKKEISSIKKEDVTNLSVYNFTVEHSHTYLVGGIGMVVHNKGAAETATTSDIIENDNMLQGIEYSYNNINLNVSRDNFFGFSNQPFNSKDRAYELYLLKREELGYSIDFFIEAARWFYNNGERELCDRIISNVREIYFYNHDKNILSAIYFYESIGEPDKAIRLLEQLNQLQRYNLNTMNALIDLYYSYDKENAISLLERYISSFEITTGNKDSSGTQSIGGSVMGLLIDYLRLNNGNNHLNGNYINTDIPWQFDIRIKANWSQNDNLSLVVIEPTGEAVFYDNFKSAIGGLYWTNYWSESGPDEYINIDAIPGTYEIYILTSFNAYYPSELSASAKITIYEDYGQNNEQINNYFISIPNEPGIYKVATIDR